MGPSGLIVGTEIISPNKLKAIKRAGLHAAVHEAYNLQCRRQEAIERMSEIPSDIARQVLEHSVPSADGNGINTQDALAILHPTMPSSGHGPLSHTGPSDPAVLHLPRLDASVLADNLGDALTIKDKVEGWVDDTPLELTSDPQTGNPSGFNLPAARIVQSACDIRIHWDELGGISEISAPTKEVTELICSKLNTLLLSDGKDSILKAILDANTSDASKILEAAEFDALKRSEGYSAYESYEAFVTLNDPRIGLSELQIANLGTVMAAILSGGLGTQQPVSKGEWPLILNQDSWFRFLITILTGAARVGARFKDLPSHGDHVLNTELASLPLSDDLPVPTTQTEMVKRLLEQLYAQFDERNDYKSLREQVKGIQDMILEKFKWLVRARVGAKCTFLSEYFSKDDLKDIMEQILLEEPRPELTEFIWSTWRKQGAAEAKKERGRVTQEAYQSALESYAIIG